MVGLMPQSGPLSVAGIVGAGVCVLWAVALSTLAVRRLQKRRRTRLTFQALAAERGFEADEAGALWTLSKHAPETTRILTSAECFDECIHQARLAADDNVLAWPEYLTESRISALHRRFAAPRRSALQIVHTRDIEMNQPLRVRLEDGSEFESFALPADAESMRMSLPAGSRWNARLAHGARVKISFWRAQDARYEFESRILLGDARERTLAVEHAAVTRLQERRHVRVRCRNEVNVAVVSQATAERAGQLPALPGPGLHGALRDVSAGGASFFTSERVDVGSWLLLSLDTGGPNGRIVVPGQVIRRSDLGGTSASICQAAVRFEPLTTRAEYRLGRFVADQQQQLIRRMMVRAGVDEPGTAPARVIRPARPQAEVFASSDRAL